MKTILTTEKSVDQAASDFEEAVFRNGFGILHTYDLKQTLEGKGFPIEDEVRIFEICNPARASEVLERDLDMNMALPCRVSVYSKDGKTCIGMINPSDMLSVLSDDTQLGVIASDVEKTIRIMMEEAV
ncbi:MAG: DUF302 domain-containing protein [Bacteroidetes bacterium]|nr:DUF302 domain-containing protein [Bacteroidota bacterium]